ncbi:MAG: phosphoribosyltransferase family protein [Candidatus Asgardarchaeia archaeon]
MTDYRLKMDAIEKLRILKEIYTYQQLERMLGIQIPVLARYVSLKNLPNVDRARKIIEFYNKIDFSDIIKSKIMIKDEIIDITEILSNIKLLRMAAKAIDVDADLVLTMAVDGIPFGTIVAERLNARIAYVKDKEEAGVSEFYQAKVSFGPGIYTKKYFLPKKLISKKDRIFLVDDILRTGKTFEILMNIANQAKAEIVGGATLIAKKDTIEVIKNKVKKFYTFYAF